MEETGLSGKIADEVLSKLQEKGLVIDDGKKPKNFKLPVTQRIGAKGKIKKNHVLVILLKTNGNVQIKLFKIDEDMIYLKESDTYHSANTDYIGYYKNYPVIILPEWDLKPLSRRDLWEKAEGGRYAKPQSIIIHNVERASGLLKKKKSFGGSLIWIILGLCVVGYLVYSMVLGK